MTLKKATSEAAALVCAQIRKTAKKDATIVMLTPYKGQEKMLSLLMPSELRVDIMTIDSCQGEEYDYAVLSTVRSNERKGLGFCKDDRRICVALSRAKMQLVIIGNRGTLSSDRSWRTILA